MIVIRPSTFAPPNRVQHLKERAADLRKKAENPAFKGNAVTFRELAISYDAMAEQAAFICRVFAQKVA